MCRLVIVLASVPATDAKCIDLDAEKEVATFPEFNPSFGTIPTYEDEADAVPRAIRILDKAIADYEKRGYKLRCAPKTVDDEHHNWRRIARVGKPGKPSVCVQVVIDGLEARFDPWMY